MYWLSHTILKHVPVTTPATLIAVFCGCVATFAVQSASAERSTEPNITLASEALSAPDISHCLAQLDATAALASEKDDDDGYLERRFAELESLCPNLPHFAHNQGVLAAQALRWPEAIKHLTRSLQLDSRASMTHRHLQQIFEHRAAQAYAKALKTPLTIQPPVLALQLSSHQNADSFLSAQEQRQYRTISTVEYELYAWWHTTRDSESFHDFYVGDFPQQAIGRGSDHLLEEQWDDMQREIAFTAQDAVVVLSDNLQNRTMMLMRMVGTRWKIYQETRL